jgi:hypothetical protein
MNQAATAEKQYQPREGAIASKLLPDGREAFVYKMIYTFRLGVGEPGSGYYEDGWCYEDLGPAMVAFAEWNGEGEPNCWTRHPNTGRRRPGGDPSKEYVIL